MLDVKDYLLQAQEQLSSKNTRRPAWMNKLILTKLRYKSTEKVEASMGNLRRIQSKNAEMQIRKPEPPGLNLARDVKGNKKDFHKHISSKRKSSENVGWLLNRTRVLLMQDMGNTEVLNASFTSVFTSKTVLQEFMVLENRGKVWSKEGLLLVKEDHVRKYLSKLVIH